MRKMVGDSEFGLTRISPPEPHQQRHQQKEFEKSANTLPISSSLPSYTDYVSSPALEQE